MSGTRKRHRIASVALGLLSLIVISPFLYMISVSLMGESELLRWPPPLFPNAATLSNYAAAMAALPYSRAAWNSAILAGFVMLGQVVTSAAAGYAFARMRFPGRDVIFNAFLATIMLPLILLAIPRFRLINGLGWLDTYGGLISTELVSVLGIVLMRRAFLRLPREVEDAARLDGAREWTLFRRVMLPLARPAIIALALIAFLEQWRNFLWPLIVTRSADRAVTEVALAQLHTAYSGNWPYQMAAGVLVTIPLWIVGLIAQRYLEPVLRITGAGAPTRL
jgi:multiple sugar transport system permease protein